MNLNIIHDDGTIIKHAIVKEKFIDKRLKNKIGYIGTQSKEANALNIFSAYFSDSKAILLDETNKSIVKLLENLNIHNFESVISADTIFDDKDFSFMYFTSGSTGHPVGAFKSKDNILSEIKALSLLLEKYTIRKVIVTVPFIHLYGTLFGLMYPLLYDIDIYLKEHFLPHDMLEMIDEYTMVVTTPLYIKALNKLIEKKDLSKSIFISSTAPLDNESIVTFNEKYQTDIMQIFGSTETGGIAHKLNDEMSWIPFEGVEVTSNEKDELKVKSPFISEMLYEEGFKSTEGEIQTFDYVELEEGSFKLIGRSSKIFKLAGKRYSTVQIENILEEIDGIRKALVFVEMAKDSLRGEYLNITIESNKFFTVNEIKKMLKKQLSNLKFSIKLNVVHEIPTNQVGKKLWIK